MARVALPVQTALVSTASALSFTAVHQGSGNSFVTDHQEMVLLRNTGATPITAVVQAQSAIQGVTIPHQTAVIPSSIVPTVWGPWGPVFTDTSGNVNVDYSGTVTQTTIAVLKMPSTGL